MEIIKETLAYAPKFIDLLAVLILLFGLVRVIIKFFKVEVNRMTGKGNQYKLFQILRCDVGLYILLALDFMIMSDLITSMTHRDLDELINLGSIVIIRTVIGYFLGKEVKEIHNTATKSQIEKNDQ